MSGKQAWSAAATPAEPSATYRAGAPDAGAPAPQIAALESSIEEAERRLAAVEAAFARELAESRRKTDFLATMSHELRTPLNAIIGFAEIALSQARGPLPAVYRGYIEDIAAAGRHMDEVVENVLEAARLESGQVTVERRPVSAHLLIAEARAMVALQAEEQGVDISGVALAGDWLLATDPVRARQIFVNLLANAIKFTPSGGAVGVEAMRAGEGVVDLAVWDTGPGIPSEHQAGVFEPFYQVPGSAGRPTAGRGAGLGLAISRQLAQLMGGEIGLASEHGKGARFTVRLPLVAAEHLAAAG